MEQDDKTSLKKLLLSRNWSLKSGQNAILQGKSGMNGRDEDIFAPASAYMDSYHPLLLRLWQARNYSQAEIEEILYPQEISYPDPFLFTEMKKAIDLIEQAVFHRKKILIFGDYDADGLTATALLSRWFRNKGIETINLIPDRLRDGYGLTHEQVDLIKKHKPDLLITVDCGSSSQEEVRLLEESGIQVIVTDHHTVEGEEHTASAFLNPQGEGENFPLQGLAGVGVAYYLIRALEYPKEPDPVYTILAAIGTVADVMPLRGHNRRLMSDAIAFFTAHAPAGIESLLRQGYRADGDLSSASIQFRLAPRLNAAGRLGEAEAGLELLLTDSKEEAKRLSKLLCDLNVRRRELEKEQMEYAQKQIEAELVYGEDRIIIVADESFHPGILGILSARLADQYQMPAICLALEEGIYRGSARTYGDLDIYEAIASCSDLLLTFGGHSGAAGLSLAAEDLPAFKTKMKNYMARFGAYEPADLLVDVEVSGTDLTLAAAHALEILEPYGEQNPQPLLMIKGVQIAEIRRIGDGSHLRLLLELKGGGRVVGLAFRQGAASLLYEAGDIIDLAFYLMKNAWQDSEEVNLHIEEMQLSKKDQGGENLALNRSMIAYVYKRLEQLSDKQRDLIFDPSHLAHWLSSNYNEHIYVEQLLLILNLFSEAGLASIRSLGDRNMSLNFNLTKERVDLKATELWQELLSQGRIIDATAAKHN